MITAAPRSVAIAPPREIRQEYSTAAVAEAIGVSLRQLQWWEENGIVHPRQIGHRRCWSRTDILRAAIVGALRRRGMTLQRVRHVLAVIRKSIPQDPCDWPFIVVAEQSGRNARVCLSESAAIAFIENSPSLVVFVRVGKELLYL